MSSVKQAAERESDQGRESDSARDRKAEHIQLALEDRIQLHANFFDDYVFDHQGLPEIDFDEIDLTTQFLGKTLNAPLLISSMTGGTGEATRINRNLAIGAERARVAIGVGSQRKAIEDPEQAASFRVRALCPSVPLLANLGAVQLNYGFGIEECRAAVDMITADALFFHVNPLQEAIQPEGQCDFSGLVEKIGQIAEQLDVPVIVKEIGCGLSRQAGERLKEVGITLIDTAGLGGTSWARIEASRANDLEIGELFADWGVSTPRSIQQLAAIPGLTVIGSGGVRNGLDAAKALAMGAEMVGLAQPFLTAAVDSPERVVEAAERAVRELKIAMFCLGARNVAELQEVEVLRRAER